MFVGPGVEVADDWLCEGIWDAQYGDGGFDRTDLVFGTGVRLRGDSAVFVSSGTTVDRLHECTRGGERYVSNSLPCLLAFLRASLDVSFKGYAPVSGTIRHGLRAYVRDLPTTAGAVRLAYFHNLSWDASELSEVPKPGVERNFGSYAAYRNFLHDAMARLAENASAPERRQPFQLVATLSTGYDSPTSTVLASEVGCGQTFGFDRGRGGQADSGAAIAEILGLAYALVETKAWRSMPMAAVPFLAALTASGSSVVFKGAESLLSGRVVFTGFHGDKMWDRDTTALGPDIVRTDASGTDLTEYRLWAGFVNCPVPYFGVRQIRDIHAISTSPDMAPWDVDGGYSRPICRRIVEERGVPRHMFGTTKKATAQFILRSDDFLTPDMQLDYEEWLQSRNLSVDVDTSGRPVLREYAFHWAVDRAKEHYRDPLLESEP